MFLCLCCSCYSSCFILHICSGQNEKKITKDIGHENLINENVLKTQVLPSFAVIFFSTVRLSCVSCNFSVVYFRWPRGMNLFWKMSILFRWCSFLSYYYRLRYIRHKHNWKMLVLPLLAARDLKRERKRKRRKKILSAHTLDSMSYEMSRILWINSQLHWHVCFFFVASAWDDKFFLDMLFILNILNLHVRVVIQVAAKIDLMR